MRIAGAAKRELRQRIGEPPWVISRCAAVAVSVLGRAAHCAAARSATSKRGIPRDSRGVMLTLQSLA